MAPSATTASAAICSRWLSTSLAGANLSSPLVERLPDGVPAQARVASRAHLVHGGLSAEGTTALWSECERDAPLIRFVGKRKAVDPLCRMVAKPFIRFVAW